MTETESFWTGELCFGIVNIPFSLGVSRKSHDHTFKQYVATNDGYSAVGRKTINKDTGLEVKQTDILRGIDIEGRDTIFLTKQEIDDLTPETNHSIQIKGFFRLNEFDFNRFDTTYHVIPDQSNETGFRAFCLLLTEMCAQHKGAFVKIKLRHREQLCLLHANRFGMVCSTLYYEDEIIKEPDFEVPQMTAQEIQTAMELVKAMTVPDSTYGIEEDTYYNQLTDLIFSKAQD